MIDLYVSIQAKLAEVPQLKYIDMVDDEHPDIPDQDSSEPTALVQFQPISWQQQGNDALYADIQFSVKLSGKPFHRSESKSPALPDLKNSLDWMHEAKKKLYEDGVEYINNICLTREHFTKRGETYELELGFKAFVEYEME
jgi:hypothetical protein